MDQFAIRCHPCTPISAGEVDTWLGAQVDALRAGASGATLRLFHLTQTLPTGETELGWLIEVDAAGGAAPVDEDQLERLLRDMRLLGLQPTVLEPTVGVVSARHESAANGWPTPSFSHSKRPNRPTRKRTSRRPS
jgi:hypothetical protein